MISVEIVENSTVTRQFVVSGDTIEGDAVLPPYLNHLLVQDDRETIESKLEYEAGTMSNNLGLANSGTGIRVREVEGDRADARRIWVDDPDVKGGGYYRTDPRTKKEEHKSAYVSQQEIAGLQRSNANIPMEHGVNDPFFVSSPNGGKSMLLKPTNHTMAYQGATEVLIAEMGASAGVPINNVRLIPGRVNSPLKDPGKPGTLHDVVPGMPYRMFVRQNPLSKLAGIDIQLAMFGTSADKTLVSASRHPDLAKILALDVFTTNRDRHEGNLMYNPKGRKFYAIDHGFAFSSSRETKDFADELESAIAYSDFRKYLPSKQSEKNLETFAKTLEKLAADNTPTAIERRAISYMMALRSEKSPSQLTLSQSRHMAEVAESNRPHIGRIIQVVRS